VPVNDVALDHEVGSPQRFRKVPFRVRATRPPCRTREVSRSHESIVLIADSPAIQRLR
jgi:hypothetical protein